MKREVKSETLSEQKQTTFHCSTETERQEIKTYHTDTHRPSGSWCRCDEILFPLLKIKESKMKLDLVVIDSLGKRWLGDPEILICYKYLKAEMTESLLGSTDD